MGLPFAPNSVPLGMNPGGKRLTTRIHSFKDVTTTCMVLGSNPNRFAAAVMADYDNNAFCNISIDPDNAQSWHTPNPLTYSTVMIYGTMAIFARPDLFFPNGPYAIIIYEYVYE